MSVSSISSNAMQGALRTPEAAEVKKAGPDHDGDADDHGGAKAAGSAAGPTVNTQGQTVGQKINVKA